MKKGLIIISIVILGTAVYAAGPVRGGGDFGLGIVVGEPTGLSWKLWTSRNRALDGAVAWAFGGNGYLRAHVDYLWHDFHMIKAEKGQMPLYLGMGGTIWSGNRERYAHNINLGLRGVIGMEYIFPEAPIDIFLELAPTFGLAPETGVDIEGGLGLRFFF
jgi:hypothetical protein